MSQEPLRSDQASGGEGGEETPHRGARDPSETSRPDGGLRIRRRCPACGAPVEHSETDAAVACGFCQIHLAIRRGATVPRYALPARLDREAATLEAKRFLRGANVRVRSLGPPGVIYIPFARLTGLVHALWREIVAAPEQARTAGDRDERSPALAILALGADLAFFPAGALLRLTHKHLAAPHSRAMMSGAHASPGEFRFRVGNWDQTVCAAPSLQLGDHSLGVRTQALPVVPLDELLAEETAPKDIPGRVAREIEPDQARAQLERKLAQAHSSEAGQREEARWLAPRREFQWIYFPYVTVGFQGPAGSGAVVLDGLTNRARCLIEDPTVLAGALEAAPGDLAGWTFPDGEDRFVALLCPTCSMPLPFRAAARLYPCTNCRHVWRTDGARLQSVAGRRLAPPPAVDSGLPGDADRLALPFYRLRLEGVRGPAGDRAHFIPAAESRHPRALWNFASALTRRNDPWCEQELAEELDSAVALDQEEAVQLLPFAWACATEGNDASLFDQTIRAAQVDLVWLRLRRETGAWVEPWSGLSIPEAALVPWPKA